MKKPSLTDTRQALEAAHELLGGGGSADAVGRYLLYLHNRNQTLEAIAEMVERYLKFGLPEMEHGKLVSLLEALRQETRDENSEESGEFGLE